MAFALLLVYLACSFIRPFELMPELAVYSPMVVLGLLALVAGLFARGMSRDPLVRRPQLVLVGLFVLWAMLSVVMSQSWLGGAAATLVSLSGNLFVFYLVVLNVDTTKRFRTAIGLLVVLLVVVSVEGILAYHTGYRAEELMIEELGAEVPADAGLSQEPTGSVFRIRSRGFLNDPNDLAQALVAGLPFVFALGRPGRGRPRLVLELVPAAIMLYAILLTRSRGGLVSLLFLAFLVLRGRLSALASGIATVAGGALLAVGVMAGRAGGAMGESSDSRIEAWRAGLEMLKSSPIWGVGYGQFEEHHERVAHNSFVHCFAELGLVGYFLWLCILFVTLQEARQLSGLSGPSSPSADLSGLATAAWRSLLSFLVAAFFLSRAYGTMLFLIIGFSSALAELARRRRLSFRSMRPLAWMKQVSVLELVSVAVVYVICRVAG